MSMLVKSSIQGHNPLPKEVNLKKSSIHGFGIFAANDIAQDFDFGITHVADNRFDNGFIRTPFGGFINHSFSPNCQIYEVDDTLHIRTVKTIKAGEELTIDYRPWYSDDELASYK